MALLKKNKYFLVLFLIGLGIFGYAFMFGNDPVDYNTAIKPLLNEKCISCHGGVKKKAGFSLLFRSEALDTTESGKRAIIPGDPDASEMIRRLSLKDPDERMPYHEDPLKKEEIDILRKWIKEGAKWGDHWAYQTVQETPVPKARGWLWGLLPADRNDWVKNDIDWFILDKLRSVDLKPMPEADKRILLRRVSIDLIGMPAPDRIAEDYLSDNSDTAYDRLVDQLMALPAYGERWTAMWMDLARYADTKGYERDDSRSIWRYRDWLIKAFNDNMPYDRFLTEQMAGDLLPDPTDAQLIATAFHRNSLTNDEGGTDNEEFRTSAVMDRVNTTWEALMSTTFACVQCHSHPYDPFRHEEYYRFMAFFNNTRDEDTYADYPLLREYKQKDSLKFSTLQQWLTENLDADEKNRIVHFLKTGQPAVNSLVAEDFVNAELADTKWLVMRNHAVSRFREINLTGKSQLLTLVSTWPSKGTLRIRLDNPNGPEIAKYALPATKGRRQLVEIPLQSAKGVHDLYFLYESPDLKNMDQNGVMFDWLAFTTEFPGKSRSGYDSAHKAFLSLLTTDQVVLTPVMQENPNHMFRETRIFERGNWLVKGELVQPAIPKSLGVLLPQTPANRLGLAIWMTSPENPLVSRTMINRLWEQLFGKGLAETLEDLGTQGLAPTHPDLMNYLSWQFMHTDKWDIRKTLKRMVMSATYRQDSKTSPEKQQQDPYNTWYARGPRVRLTAEQVRDQALMVSGVLSDKMYGPSVMPYQPEGIWQSPWNGQNWVMSQGQDRYRRAIYTYWKRSSPYPSMMNFDGTSREVCNPRRIRTNTPLQALTILNDSAYLDMARNFVYALTKAHGLDPLKVIPAAYLRAAGYPLTKEKQKILTALYTDALQRFKKHEEMVCAMIGEQNQYTKPETAALVVVANAIFNLDEVITKN